MTAKEKLQALHEAQERLKQELSTWAQSDFEPELCQALLKLIRYDLGSAIYELNNTVSLEEWTKEGWI